MLFEKFKGISAEREIKKREKNSLEHLIQTGENAVNEFRHFLDEKRKYFRKGELQIGRLLRDFRMYIEKQIGDFNESDLRSYIFAKANSNYANTSIIYSTLILYGAYTGCLLSLLTERNRAKGLRTRFYINGANNEFCGLFFAATSIDSLFIENFKGEGICLGPGIYRGNINTVIARNIEGEGVLCGAGGIEGRVNLIIAKNCAGNEILNNAIEKGKTGLIIAENIQSENCMNQLGKDGKISMVIAKNIEGREVLNDLAVNRGRIGVVAGIDIIAQRVLCNIGWKETKGYEQLFPRDPKVSGLIRTLLYENVRAQYTALPTDTGIKNRYSKEKSPEEYAKQMHEYKINEILELVDSMEGKTPEEVFDIADKIQAVYDSIKEKVEK